MIKNFNSKYGEILQEYRKINHFTQEQVSELTGLAPKYISQIERGELKGSINTLLAFCKAYNVTPNDILLNFIDSNHSATQQSYDERINSLSLKDKKMIDNLLDYLIKNR